jgi:hypothetical protein
MKQILPLIASGFVILSSSAGCVEKSRHLSAEEHKELKNLISESAPRPQHPLNIRFEDKVRLLGYDLNRSPVRPGEPFQVTWYWKVENKIGDGWLQFTHLADAKNVNRINVDAERAVRRLHPPSDWKPGEYIKDMQEITLPPNWNSNEVKFYLGLWNGPHRLHVISGPNDGDNRALGLTVPVTVPESSNPLVRLPAIKVSGPIKIDGKLDEADWSKAPVSTPLVEPLSGKPGSFKASVRVMYDQTRLYVAFEVADTFLKSSFTKNDEHLWTQDAVEMMVDPDGDGKNYFEVQASPSAVVFDTRYDLRRQPAPYGYLDWNSQATVKVVTSGKVNDDEPDVGYTVEMSIPFKAFGVTAAPVATAEKPASWRVNFFVMNSSKDSQRAVAWSAPLIPDFHTLDRFGQLEFLDGNAGPNQPPASPTADKPPVPVSASAKKSPLPSVKKPIPNKGKSAPAPGK